jgi:hypothetical protein
MVPEKLVRVLKPNYYFIIRESPKSMNTHLFKILLNIIFYGFTSK